jgi:hypothetical protein
MEKQVNPLLSDLMNRVAQSTEITSLIAEYHSSVGFEKGENNNVQGYCPFHKDYSQYPEKTLLVSKQKQIFYCTTCEKGGDIFNFILYSNDLNRSQAALFLAKRAGISIDPSLVREEKERPLEGIAGWESFAEQNPLEGIAEWEDFVEQTEKSYEVTFLKRLVSSGFAYNKQVMDYFQGHENGRLKTPSIKAIFSYFAENTGDPELKMCLGTDLFGQRKLDEVLKEVNKRLPNGERRVSKETMEYFFKPDPKCTQPAMRDLEVPFAQIKYEQFKLKIGNLDPEKRKINPSDLEHFIDDTKKEIEERGWINAD